MKSIIKLILIWLVKNLLKVFWLSPIKNSKLVFAAHEGKAFFCNPKYIYMYLNNAYCNIFDYVWVYNNKADLTLFPLGVRLVEYNSAKYFYEIMTCKVFVNNMVSYSYIPFRKEQNVVATWHGGGAYKRAGVHVLKGEISRKKIELVAKNVTHFVSGCKLFSGVMADAFLVNRDIFFEVGMPRNDILLSRLNAEVFRKVADHYAIPKTKKIVLYAPTFRSKFTSVEHSVHLLESSLDFEKMKSSLCNRFGGDWCVVVRAHPLLSAQIKGAAIIDASNYPDMQELLCAADVLINDYSSSMWDFSLTGKPCFIYATDVEEYAQDRNFYTPISEWPFPLATNNKELADNILNFDEEKYREKVKKHHEALGICETGHASQLWGDKIYDICFGNDNKQAVK